MSFTTQLLEGLKRMFKPRLIARLDIKGENLIKGVHLEGLRKIGNPNKFALEYYKKGVDELLFMDCVASLYGRNNLVDVIKNCAPSPHIFQKAWYEFN